MTLAHRLEQICAAEQMLAPAVALFQLTLSMNGQSIAELAAKVAAKWKGGLPNVHVGAIEELKPDLHAATGQGAMAARWIDIARGLSTGDYAQVLAALLEQNRDVMIARSGAAPWITTKGGVLDVRFQDEESTWLPDQDEVRRLLSAASWCPWSLELGVCPLPT